MTTELALALNNLTAAVTQYGNAVQFLSINITLAIVFCCATAIYLVRNTKR